MTEKYVRKPKKPEINNHILLKSCDTNCDDFSIILNESNVFKLLLKESLLIEKDQPELNINVYSYPFELFD